MRAARAPPVQTQVEAQMVVIFDFIKGWYNPRPRHSVLGYQSPIDNDDSIESIETIKTRH
jgi:hypothetical protein